MHFLVVRRDKTHDKAIMRLQLRQIKNLDIELEGRSNGIATIFGLISRIVILVPVEK